MWLYLIIITCVLTTSGVINAVVANVTVFEVVLYTFTGLCGVAALAVIPHFLVRTFPKKLFEPERKYFRPCKCEKRFYRLIRVQRWKKLVPDAGGKVANFGKSSLTNPNDKAYLYKFLTETCYSEVVHSVCSLNGFLILLISLFFSVTFFIMLPIAILNFLLHLLPVFIQRYLRPKLLYIYNKKNFAQETMTVNENSGNL